MALHADYRSESPYSQPFQFQRGVGKLRIKKVQKKLTLKFKHIFLFFFLIIGIFYSLMRAYLFLISWDELKIKKVEVQSAQEGVSQEIQDLVAGRGLGNILLLDIAGLQRKVEAHRWVKAAQVRKIFPATLKIAVQEREPRALLRKGNVYYLIDEEGVVLERAGTREECALPVLADTLNFAQNYREKLNLAWECLNELDPSVRMRVEAIDLSDERNLALWLKESPTRLLLGHGQFSEKVRVYLKNQAKWEGQFGGFEYVDLRFQDRITLKPQEKEEARLPNSNKEDK